MAEPLVGVVMGSRSDLAVMQRAIDILDELGVPHEVKVLSAHRTPVQCAEYAERAADRGLRVLIAGAGGAAALPGALAAMTLLPVFGIPMAATPLAGVDALLSMAQMPGGVPVGTLGIGTWGATNAALLAAQVLALQDRALGERLRAWRDRRAKEALESLG